MQLPARQLILLGVAMLSAGMSGCDTGGSQQTDSGVPQADAQGSPKVYWVELETSVGDIVLEVHRDWSPHGADQFYKLIEAEFYDECRFFRAIPGFMAQVGMHGDPLVNMEWSDKTIADDPVVRSNQRGYATFAKTGQPNSRSTQFFINFTDNSRLDTQGFAPFAKVINGMDVVDKINTEYDERPQQHRIAKFGNRYLDGEFPNLDYIVTARIVEEPAIKDPEETDEDADSQTDATGTGKASAEDNPPADAAKNADPAESSQDSDGEQTPGEPQ